MLKIAILGEELHPRALGLEPFQANIVIDPLDQRRLKILDVLLDKGNIFVEELLLKRLVRRADDCHLARAHHWDEIRQTVMGWNHRATSQIEMAGSINLDTTDRTRIHFAHSHNIAVTIALRAIVA